MNDADVPRRIARFGARGARAAADGWDAAGQRLRRARLLAAIRAAAFRVHAEVDVSIAADVWLGTDIRVTVEPGSRNRLAVAPGSRIEDRVLIMLKGGDVDLGPRSELRRGVVLNVAGALVLRSDNPVSWNSVIHCSNRVELAPMAGLAEQVTIADSSHFWTTPEEHFWHNVAKMRTPA